MLHLRSRFNDWGGQQWIEHQWTPQLQRQNDASLMKAFSRLPGATKRKLEKCNMRRLYSKVITLSDISDPRGTYIPWEKTSGNWKSESTLQFWPTMPKPPRDYWTTYRSFTRKAFCKNENHTAPRVSLTLDTKLGPWYDITRHIAHTHLRTQSNLYPNS